MSSDDVVDVTPELDLRTRSGRRLKWGQPNPCPLCGVLARLDAIDVRQRLMYLTCAECGTSFTVAEAETTTSP